MKALNYLRNYFFLALIPALFGTSYIINNKLIKPPIVISKQNQIWSLNNKMILKFNLGFKRLESSLLWISTILESDIEHYRSKDLNSWMFQRFNSISELEPKFYENYAFGGPYLSIIKDDITGASFLYKKGLSHFPDDYNLLKNAGFHFYFEAADYNEARPIYKKLKTFPLTSPAVINTLSRIEASDGNLNDAFELLSDLQQKYDRSGLIGEKIYQQRYAIKSEIDLKCLNEHKQNCQHTDLDNVPYLRSGIFFQASKKWIPYRIKKKPASNNLIQAN